MLQRILLGIFGSRNQRFLKSIAPIIQAIGQAEAQFQQYSDEDLFNMTAAFKGRLSAGETLDDILPEAFAVVKETAKRFVNNTSIKVKANAFDREVAGGKDYVTLDGDYALWANSWDAAERLSLKIWTRFIERPSLELSSGSLDIDDLLAVVTKIQGFTETHGLSFTQKRQGLRASSPA